MEIYDRRKDPKYRKSGTLDSPYGFFTVVFDGKRYCNGHPVVNNECVGETVLHYVPDHWIKPNEEAARR